MENEAESQFKWLKFLNTKTQQTKSRKHPLGEGLVEPHTTNSALQKTTQPDSVVQQVLRIGIFISHSIVVLYS